MWGFILPRAGHQDLDAELERFQPVVLDCLGRLDLGEVRFQGSSDLRWRDRKLGGLTAHDTGTCTSVGGFLNIAPPDLDLYLSVVRVPDEKFRDKAVKDMREYVCTAEEVAGRPVTYDEFRDALLAALEGAGIKLDRSELTEDERAGIARTAARIGTDEYVRRISSERFAADGPPGARVGFGNHKGKKLCRAGVAVGEDGTIVAAMMAGDMHVAPPDAIDRVAEALVGAQASDEAELRARIAPVFEGPGVHQADAAMGVTTDDLLAAVRRAIENAGGEGA